jgi:hypothetical protein
MRLSLLQSASLCLPFTRIRKLCRPMVGNGEVKMPAELQPSEPKLGTFNYHSRLVKHLKNLT